MEKYQLIAEETVRTKIELAERTLNECFNMLLDLKHAREGIDKALMTFQPKLAECLYGLMQFYKELHHEKIELISIKDEYDKAAFAEIMRKNAQFSKIVSEVIRIGKRLGDAFMWLFFKDNRLELDKHFEHKATGLYVGGIGGRGELEFIKNTNSINGLYVLYHSITTMLRVGDFSLYDFKHGVVGIGEIKTKYRDNKLEVSIGVTSKQKLNSSGNVPAKPIRDRVQELKRDFPRVEKQLADHPRVLFPEKSEYSSKLYASYEYEILKRLSPQHPAEMNRDNSLLLLANWSKYKSLFEVLSEDEPINEYPEDLANKLETLMMPSSPYNEAIISEITTQMDILRIPVLWWHVDDEMCRDLYFERVNIATIFNPAKLLQLFVDDGFTVSRLGKLKDIEIFKMKDNYTIYMEHFESICGSISQNLMRTEDAYVFVHKILSNIEDGEYQENTKIDMRIHLCNFGERK